MHTEIQGANLSQLVKQVLAGEEIILRTGKARR